MRTVGLVGPSRRRSTEAPAKTTIAIAVSVPRANARLVSTSSSFASSRALLAAFELPPSFAALGSLEDAGGAVAVVVAAGAVRAAAPGGSAVSAAGTDGRGIVLMSSTAAASRRTPSAILSALSYAKQRRAYRLHVSGLVGAHISPGKKTTPWRVSATPRRSWAVTPGGRPASRTHAKKPPVGTRGSSSMPGGAARTAAPKAAAPRE